MSETPRKPPEVTPEAGPEAPGSRLLAMPELGDLLGMSERAARDWVKRHSLPLVGARPVKVAEAAVLAQMATEGRNFRKPPEELPEVPGSAPEGPGSAEPIEVTYRVTPAEIERAVERTGQFYVTDMATLYDRISAELGQVYEGQLAAKDETIAELRRRAEVAEAQAALLAQRETIIAAQHETIERLRDEAIVAEKQPNVWVRLGRWWRGM